MKGAAFGLSKEPQYGGDEGQVRQRRGRRCVGPALVVLPEHRRRRHHVLRQVHLVLVGRRLRVEMALPSASSESDFMHVSKKTRCSPRLNKGSASPRLDKSNTAHSNKKTCAVKPTDYMKEYRRELCKSAEPEHNQSTRQEQSAGL
uniref:Uncharacterized protein n=1 Tax=Oryza barthii TaxID=65489 RepID=A0A0D3H1Q7_9ORYZ